MRRLPICDPQTTPTTGDVDESQPVVAMITWSDDDPKATSLKLSQSINYHVASDAGGGVRHTVTATLTDQYGDPMPGVTVHFWSNAIVGDRGSAGGTTANDDLFKDNDGLGGAKSTALAGGADIGTWNDADTDGVVDDGEGNVRHAYLRHEFGHCRQLWWYRQDQPERCGPQVVQPVIRMSR